MQVSRRHMLAASAALPLLAAIGAGASSAAAAPVARPEIRPRADWAGSLAPTGRLDAEEDVRFLLVHHSQTTNGDAKGAIASRIRSMYRYHTGGTKRWNDVAYNFFVDPYGVIWEGRKGSLAGPVAADATGGSQGFAQLVCLIGDFTSVPPTRKAQTSIIALLAWLAKRNDIDLNAGKTIEFVSRGSTRWPAGRRVTTYPVAGHRDMSMTECPGDACYPLVRSTFLKGAQDLTAAAEKATESPSASPTSPSASPASASANPKPTSTTADEPIEPTETPATQPENSLLLPLGAAGGLAAVAGAVTWAASRGRDG